MPIYLAIFIGQVDIGSVVVGFMHRQSAGIRMMPASYAAGSGKEPLRQVRAGAAIVQQGREDTGLESARNAGAIGRIDQPRADQALQNAVFIRVRESGTV